ncbi:hypothetical protein OSTOST_17975 [Ostertagia ostertagi]
MTLHEEKPSLTALRASENQRNPSDRRVPCDQNITLDPEKRNDVYPGFPQFEQPGAMVNAGFLGESATPSRVTASEGDP